MDEPSAGSRVPDRAPETTVPVMSPAEQHAYRGLALLWLLATIAFWAWWLQPSHIVSIPRFVVTTLVIAYALAMPAYFLFFVGRMRRPNPALAPPPGLRVAFATTFVPGAESPRVLERTIVAMRDQHGHPHDVWVLDEGDLPEVRELCRRVGAQHFSRRGVARYQGAAWPFKARTKAGNYNAWLDWLERQEIHYDVLLQMDTDHVPQPGYMLEMLRPFADPTVAYVAAPSITSGNRGDSWVVSARYELESTLHGPLQMGYNGGHAPLIIGSHAAFRLPALRAIGGFQHTLAEDHHNTLRLTATGLRGVFSPDAIAIGDGAPSFADAMVQEYQWARALTQILLNFFPFDGRTLRPRLWLQFLFAETWYPLFAASQALGWLLPIAALLTDRPLVQVSYVQFIGIHALGTLTCLALVTWLRRRGWLRPANVPVVTWRSALLTLARWPFVLMAVLEASVGWLLRRDFPFRVTPKGARERKALPARILLPYVVIVAGSLLAVANRLHRGGSAASDGYLYLALLNAATYILVIGAVVALNLGENVRTWRVRPAAALRMHVPGYGAALVLAALLGGLGGAALPRAAYAVLWQSPDHLRSAVGALSTPGTGDRCPTLGATALELATRGGAGRAGGGGEAAAAPVAGDACPSVFLPPERPFLGVYDPGGAMTGPADVEEVFVQWKPTAGQEVRAHLQRVAAQRRVALVVVEPYPWNVGGLGEQTLLADIAGGGYDSAIAGIAEAVRELQPSPVLLRFGHEMDLTGLYPWSRNDPAASVAAYRHFVNRVRETAPNARFIWSPSGAAGSDRFYPGDDVVDAVGISLLVAEDWSGSDAYPSFAQLVRDHGVLATRHGKPLVVAETGAAIHDPAAQLRWVREARAAIDQFPGLLGVVYFDDRCPPLPWPGAARPDWRLTPAGLSVFFATPSSDLP